MGSKMIEVVATRGLGLSSRCRRPRQVLCSSLWAAGRLRCDQERWLDHALRVDGRAMKNTVIACVRV